MNILGILGGGLFIDNSSPTLKKLRITQNYALLQGGGIFIQQDASPKFYDIEIFNNGDSLNPGDGGGVSSHDSSPIFRNVKIYNNYGLDGGGVYIAGTPSAVRMINTNIYHNHASHSGGGIVNNGGENVYENVKIFNNQAGQNGGGIWLGGLPTLRNVEILRGA